MVATRPDAVLVLGDTNSCLSVIGAKRLHIPIFHMEAGNRCKDECLPEETNRRIVDIISDVNMAYSEHARRYLAECGLPRERTYVTGSPMAEVLHQNLAEIEASDVHQRLGLEKGKYILLSAHREENIDTEKNFLSLCGHDNEKRKPKKQTLHKASAFLVSFSLWSGWRTVSSSRQTRRSGVSEPAWRCPRRSSGKPGE